MESVVFAVAAAAGLLGGRGPVVLTGGGGRPDVVQQLLADVLAVPVRYLPIRSASAVGAALLAARGTGTGLVAGRPPGRPLEPRPDPGLAAAFDRWRAERGPGLPR